MITTVVSVAWTFISALTISSIIRVMIYLMVSISMIRLRLLNPGDKSFFKVRYGYFLAVASIGFAVWLLLSTKGEELRDVGIAGGIGMALYVLFELFKMRDNKYRVSD